MTTYTELTDLDWLDGRADVYVFGDGAMQGPFTVTDGTLTLDVPVTKGYVGLGYAGRVRTLPEDRGRSPQLSRYAARNLDRVGVEFVGFAKGVRVNPNYDVTAPVSSSAYAVFPSREMRDPNTGSLAIRRHVYDPEITGEWGKESHVQIDPHIGLPLQVQCIEYTVSANG